MRILFIAAALMVAGSAAAGAPKQVGTMPVPVITDVTAVSTASFDPTSEVYRYDYSVKSGAGNKGNIESLDLDDRAPADYVAPNSSGNYTISRGKAGLVPFDQERDEMSYVGNHSPGTLVEVGIQGPAGWMGSVSADGSVGVAYIGPAGQLLMPGTGLVFTITSPNQPVIKTLYITPDWVLETDGEADEAEQTDAAQVEQEILIKKPVLAPGAEWPGSREHWIRFQTDLSTATTLGWIKDGGLAQTLQRQLAAARQAFDTQGAGGAIPALRSLLATIEASTPAQRDGSAYALLKLNTAALIAHAGDTLASRPVRSQPHLSLTPEKQTPRLGSSATVTAQLVDQGKGGAPIAGYPLQLRVLGGPDAGKSASGTTDAQGQVKLTLQSTKPGTDMVELRDKGNLLFAQVEWGGGAHLVVEALFPPVIRWSGHGTVTVQERTANWGDAAAGPSVTRYYAIQKQPFDPSTATVLGERPVPALQPQENSVSPGLTLSFPASLPPGVYEIVACADADGQVTGDGVEHRCNSQGMHAVMMAAPAGH